jgi:hypothetical protein
MGKLSIGSVDIKKVAGGLANVKKISFGTTELWSDEPWPSSPMFKVEWIDCVYASSGFMAVQSGMVGANATDRAMNTDYWNASLGSQNQWAAIKVGTLSAAGDTAAWTGAAVRHTGSGCVVGHFTGERYQIRTGASSASTTSAGTVRAEATFASLPAVPNPAVGDWFGIICTTVDATNAKYELWLRDTMVLSWTGASGYAGNFAGIASSGSTAGRIDEWKAGAF